MLHLVINPLMALILFAPALPFGSACGIRSQVFLAFQTEDTGIENENGSWLLLDTVYLLDTV
ncbi:MAG: hypothetical protein ACR5LF_12465 [Symbiopectobacterium sp.]